MAEISDTVKKMLRIIPIENAHEILKISLVKALKPLKGSESNAYNELTSVKVEKSIESQITH